MEDDPFLPKNVALRRSMWAAINDYRFAHRISSQLGAVRELLGKALALQATWEGRTAVDSLVAGAQDNRRLRAALRALVERCDGPAGVLADGSNIDTRDAHAALGDLDDAE